jgi:hypothetical protein
MFRTTLRPISVGESAFVTCPSFVVQWQFSLLFKIDLLVHERAVFKTWRLQYNIQDQASTTYFIPLPVQLAVTGLLYQN